MHIWFGLRANFVPKFFSIGIQYGGSADWEKLFDKPYSNFVANKPHQGLIPNRTKFCRL